MVPQKAWLTRNAGVGLILWIGVFLYQWQHAPDLVATVSLLLMLAILVNTPLALSLIQMQELPSAPYRWACRLQPLAALSAAWSLSGYMYEVVDTHVPHWSAWLAVPWLIFAALLALDTLWQLRYIARMSTSERMRLAAILYLAIGAAWLLAFQLGLQPMGFSGIIVLLTAVHFHFTGFAATIWASIIGEMIPRSHQLYHWFVGGFVIATPLIAVGITLSPLLEIGGVLLLTTMLLGLTMLLYRHVLPALTDSLAKLLLAVSPCAMIVAITLAMIYGMGEYLQISLLTIPQMVQWHGWLNAVGFIFLGLLGWQRVGQHQTIKSQK